MSVRNKSRFTAVIAMSAMVMQAQAALFDNKLTFDTDSGWVSINNRASGCISNCMDDFEGVLMDSGRAIKGFRGVCTKKKKKGTIVWKIEDDIGKTMTFWILNSYYILEGKSA